MSRKPIFAIANQKGGVGKTTVTVGLAVAFAELGLRGLVIDLDPQGNTTARLLGRGVRPSTVGSFALVASLSRLQTSEDPTLSDAVEPAAAQWAGLHVAGAETVLAEIEQDGATDQAVRLADRLAGDPDGMDRFDVVLIDCPPNLGKLSVSALVAATHLLMVTEPAADSAEALLNVSRTADVVRRTYRQTNPEPAGVIINRWRPGLGDHDFWTKEIRNHYGDLCLPGVVPERAAVADAVSTGVPVQALSGPGGVAVSLNLASMAAELCRRVSLETREAVLS